MHRRYFSLEGTPYEALVMTTTAMAAKWPKDHLRFVRNFAERFFLPES